MATDTARQNDVLRLLQSLRGIEPLKELFWRKLGYTRKMEPLSRRELGDTARDALAEDPMLFAAAGEGDGFQIIYLRLGSDGLRLGDERPVVSSLLKTHPYSLFIFSNKTQDRWHFLNVKYDDSVERRRLFRRITVGPEERLRTASERVAMLAPDTIGPDLFGLSRLAIQSRHDEAFDVEAVTDEFFAGYTRVFTALQGDSLKHSKDRRWAHDYALQFLNRCMFLYFIQRKRWLGEDPDFLASFWSAYRAAGQPKNSFVDRWLNVLFFEAFNRKTAAAHRHFPDKIRDALVQAPYLNGGLFTENDLDRHSAARVSDERFGQAFDFLERYNFTIAEDSPLDKEVAVDPEMIGKVYESLVNVSEEVDKKGEAGIFYTPRTEIDLMCRLALTDNLANHLGREHKSLLNHLVFSLEPGEKLEADRAVSAAGLWSRTYDLLRNITVLDPACGSGSFLVGMLHILDELQERAQTALGRKEASFDRKRRIIGQSLYGVDVMKWACSVAELRLWLALIVDAEFTLADLTVRQDPLLPHFSFKIRCGDSLVQEVGGVNLGHMRGALDLPADIRRAVAALKAEKLKFYNNDRNCRFRNVRDAEQEELRLFRDILGSMKDRTQHEIQKLTAQLKGPEGRQMRLDGSVEKRPRQLDLKVAQAQEQIEALAVRLTQIGEAQAALKTVKDVPFVWDIAFVEVFEGDTAGFDVIVGNPPYVSYKEIEDPQGLVAREQYIHTLRQSVVRLYPRFFSSAENVSGRSDLYVYFYLHALALLKSGGSFCFVTSNSWLDVDFGAALQDFLLRSSHIVFCIDNESKRSFAQAAINTTIVLLRDPQRAPRSRDEMAELDTRFVMFLQPYEGVMGATIMQEVHSCSLPRTVTPSYRVVVKSQMALFTEGLETEPTGGLSAAPVYSGAKWGGVYLRAPDLFFRLHDEAFARLGRLSATCRVVPGMKVPGYGSYILPMGVSTADRKRYTPILKDPGAHRHSVITEPDSVVDGRKCAAAAKSAKDKKAPVLWLAMRGDRHIVYTNPKLWPHTGNFFGIVPKNRELDPVVCAAVLGSTVYAFLAEVYGRKMFGGGASILVKSDLEKLPFVACEALSTDVRRRLMRAFAGVSRRCASSLFEDLGFSVCRTRGCQREGHPYEDFDVRTVKLGNAKSDRVELDTAVLNAMGLDAAILPELYASTLDLMRQRAVKARSL